MGDLVRYGDFKSRLDAARRITPKGIEYWTARDLQGVLGYDAWESMDDLINKAQQSCESAGIAPGYHFRSTSQMVKIGSGAQRKVNDWWLTRYACYLVAMCGDPRKREIGFAQTYFAIQTRRQEIADQGADDDKRIELRNRVKGANRALHSAASGAGVVRFGLFNDEGYKGLYGGLGLNAIKDKKGIPQKHDLLDRAGREELAANEFRITQTEGLLVREGVRGEEAAIRTHRDVGRKVRYTIKKIGGRMPETLPPEAPISQIEARRRRLSAPDDSTKN